MCFSDKRKGTLREWVREEKKKNPNFKMKGSSNAPQNNTEEELPGITLLCNSFFFHVNSAC